MRSPLELMDRGYEHALLTTYSFNLRFFEDAVLRALWGADVRNVVVLADPAQLGDALSDRAPSAAGRAYHLVAARLARAAFHSKLILLTGGHGARLCVSSANLTPDGLMRNAETLIAFDSHVSGHTAPILEAGELFRRLSETAPAHTASAILAALARLPEPVAEPSPFTLLHNLDTPLIDAFPYGTSLTAIAPFVDAGGAAAAELHQRASLTVIVDGDEIAAGPGFFAGPWQVEARTFTARLHGKAYDLASDRGRWTLVGSPNLSTPALQQTALTGNFEVAVAISGGAPLPMPASEPWAGDELEAQARARLEHEPAVRTDPASTGWAFNAWEDEQRIHVSGLPDGTVMQRWYAEQWIEFGEVIGSAVLIADPELRPTRLRAQIADGRYAYAIVARPAQLRARMRAPTGGRQSEAVRQVPLDIEAVRVLEDVLSELYTLSEIVGETQQAEMKLATTASLPTVEDGNGLLCWMPRSPEEEPRIPQLYVNAWKGEPDALLMLISRVLRLEPEPPRLEQELLFENLDLDDLEAITSEAQIDAGAAPEAKALLRAERTQLERYRRAFINLLMRGGRFIASTGNPTLAAWAFGYLMRLLEELGAHRVLVDDRSEPMLPQTQLSTVRVDLLVAYLARDERDPVALASARAHLATAVRERVRQTARNRERIDELGYRWAAELISELKGVPAPDDRALGLGTSDAAIWLEEYANRSRWAAIEAHAADILDPARIEMLPYPAIVGCASFNGRLASPAWRLVAFAAPASAAAQAPFAVIIHNIGEGPVKTHVLIDDPPHRVLIEAFQRAADRRWLINRFQVTRRSMIGQLASPVGLETIAQIDERADLLSVDGPLGQLEPVIRAAGAALA